MASYNTGSMRRGMNANNRMYGPSLVMTNISSGADEYVPDREPLGDATEPNPHWIMPDLGGSEDMVAKYRNLYGVANPAMGGAEMAVMGAKLSEAAIKQYLRGQTMNARRKAANYVNRASEAAQGSEQMLQASDARQAALGDVGSFDYAMPRQRTQGPRAWSNQIKGY